MKRELRDPQFDVFDAYGSGSVSVEFVVPYSKFGAVDVILEREAAKDLGEQLIKAAALVSPKGAGTVSDLRAYGVRCVPGDCYEQRKADA